MSRKLKYGSQLDTIGAQEHSRRLRESNDVPKNLHTIHNSVRARKGIDKTLSLPRQMPQELLEYLKIACLNRGGQCPVCKSVEIVDKNCKRTVYCQIDHFYPDKFREGTVWLTCDNCNTDLWNEVRKREDYTEEFNEHNKVLKIVRSFGK